MVSRRYTPAMQDDPKSAETRLPASENLKNFLEA
jgi:hypothetical protein